jgi:hypothetical protein
MPANIPTSEHRPSLRDLQGSLPLSVEVATALDLEQNSHQLSQMPTGRGISF